MGFVNQREASSREDTNSRMPSPTSLAFVTLALGFSCMAEAEEQKNQRQNQEDRNYYEDGLFGEALLFEFERISRL